MELPKRILKNELVAICIGVVYLWFGTLKFFPHQSPAENLAKDTIGQLSFGLLPSDFAIVILACIEVTIGMLLLLNVYRKTTVIVALFHIAFTFAPLILFAEKSFQYAPVVPTLLGQYIGKNLIIMGALISLLRRKKTISL